MASSKLCRLHNWLCKLSACPHPHEFGVVASTASYLHNRTCGGFADGGLAIWMEKDGEHIWKYLDYLHCRGSNVPERGIFATVIKDGIPLFVAC